jgi:PAS domain S-box-containing protein
MRNELGDAPLFILAPVGRDRQVIADILSDAGLKSHPLASFAVGEARLEEGAGLIVAEEAFQKFDPSPLHDWLDRQPPWSDYPIILLRMRDASVTPATLAFIESLGKVTILERPLHPLTLVTAARSALRARLRQREAESHLADRDRTAEVLRESEARFRALADSAPVLIWMADRDGAFLYANRLHEAFFGRPAASLLGFAWRDALHPLDADRVVAEFDQAAAARAAWETEFRVLDAQREVRWLRCKATPHWADLRLSYVGCSIDVTVTRLAAAELEQRVEARTAELASANRRLVAEMEERLQMAEALRHAQRMEAVGQLTAGVAHDFNNLLTVVLGGIPFLERSAGPAEKRRLAMMRVAAERGAKLTAQLLAFSRRQKLEPKPVDLNQAVISLRDLLQSTIGGGYDLQTRLEPEPWLALVDPTQIEMIILNLAINARDAMEIGGRLTVATANAVINEAPERPEEPAPGEYVMISVADTGSGMLAEVLDRAFEPFFTTKPVGRGSGLGLSQVLGFASQSGGGVRIETEVGKGTCVEVYLPRARSVAADIQPAARLEKGARFGRSRRVLLVDDDDIVRESTAMMLKDLGFQVLQAASGGAALEELGRADGFDLMVIDFAMPGMNGAEVARIAAERMPELPMLFITGYADRPILDQVEEEQILSKPFDHRILEERLAKLFAQTVAPARFTAS